MRARFKNRQRGIIRRSENEFLDAGRQLGDFDDHELERRHLWAFPPNFKSRFDVAGCNA
jgi:hypothetical protein